MSGLRGIRIIGLTIALFALTLYGRYASPFITLEECLAEPERCDGIVITVGGETVVHELMAEGFTIRRMGRITRVVGATDGVHPGEYVQLVGVFHQPGWLEAEKIYVAQYRRAKIWSSLLPVIGVLVFFIVHWRLRAGRFQPRDAHA
ncbi:hypothetical protein JW992_11040 [candidate division KSB1 bacterium]|nr:hypothetical protein [candidate division KSB1 bacterium]